MKIGDKIRIRRLKDLQCEYEVDGNIIHKGSCFVPEMVNLCGSICTVTRIASRRYINIQERIGERYDIWLRTCDTQVCLWMTFNEYMLEDENGRRVIFDES